MCLIVTDVYAASYTDYTFEGYTYEERENTDTYKYEKIKLNKFYKLIETDSAYLEKDKDGIYDACDSTDTKNETVYTRSLPENVKGSAFILSKYDGNPFITKILLNSIEHYSNQKLQEIDVYNGDTKVDISIPNYDFLTDGLKEAHNLKSKEIEIVLPYPIRLNDLKTTIYYDEPFYLTHGVFDESGNSITRNYSSLNTMTDNTTFYSLNLDEYENFIEKYSFPNGKTNYYYTYDKILYRYYNVERLYHDTLELDYLDGYVYDEEESIVAYKIYKRELIAEETPIVDKEIPTQTATPNEIPTENADQEATKKPISVTPSSPTNIPTKIEKKHIITPVEYESKNETGAMITDDMIEKQTNSKVLAPNEESCETVYLIDGKHVIVIAILIFLAILLRALYRLYVNDKN